MSKVIKSKYLPSIDIFQAGRRPSDSWFWKSWNGATNLLRECCRWQVGNGSRINIWENRWLKDDQIRKVSSIRPNTCMIHKVKDLLDSEKIGWNEELLIQCFNQADIQAIKQTPINILGSLTKWSRIIQNQVNILLIMVINGQKLWTIDQVEMKALALAQMREMRSYGQGFGI